MASMEYQVRGAGERILPKNGERAKFRQALEAAICHAAMRGELVFVDGRGSGWPYASDAWVEMIAVHKDGKLQACTDRGAALLRTCGIEPDSEPVPIKLPGVVQATEHPTLQEVFENFRRTFDRAAAEVLLAVDQASKQ